MGRLCLQTFFGAASRGSWLITLPQAGHQQFLKAPWLLDRAFDILCGRGKDSRKVCSSECAGSRASRLCLALTSAMRRRQSC